MIFWNKLSTDNIFKPPEILFFRQFIIMLSIVKIPIQILQLKKRKLNFQIQSCSAPEHSFKS